MVGGCGGRSHFDNIDHIEEIINDRNGTVSYKSVDLEEKSERER